MAKFSSSWRNSISVSTEVDLLEYKDEFIEILTNKELEEEIERRKEENEVIDKKSRAHNVDVEVDIDLYDYIDESLNISSDYDLIDELERRGFEVIKKSKMNNYFVTQKELSKFLGLKWWSTKEQIINEIKDLY
jgi:hypothetical protein